MVVIRLLGAPSIEVDGAPAAGPRGHKTWALLAYLTLAERPPTRHRLATLLFGSADDPLGALRWNLAELRRGLRPHAEITGEPVTLVLAPGVTTDIARLRAGVLPGPGADDAGGGELLEGMAFAGCPGLESWLLVERRRLAATAEALVREGALADLAAGRLVQAVEAASRLVALDPLEETHHELLVRALATSGRREQALAQADRCERLLRRELGTAPSPAVRAAADAMPLGGRRPFVGRAGALAQLEAGQAAVQAGAVDAGLQCLRRAVGDARDCGDEAVALRAMVALGSALVHAVRGRDEEGAAVLHEALVGAGDHPRLAGRVCRELGFADVQAGRRERAEQWLLRSQHLAAADDELAAVLGVRGMNLSDMARYGEALDALERSVELARAAGDRRQAAWSGSLVGRVHLLRGDLDAAARALDASLAVVRDERWMAFAPWPEALRAEVDRSAGRPEAAAEGYAHSFAVACQLQDPCWEGMGARGHGMLESDARRTPAAVTWLDDAVERCTRWPDAYQWVRGYVLDAAAGVAVAAGDPRAGVRVDRLAEVAARGGMRELVVRAHVHAAHLGRAGAAQAAAQCAEGIDNPVLDELVAAL